MVKLRRFSYTQNKRDLDRIGHIFSVMAKYEVGAYVDKLMHKEKLSVHIPRHGYYPDIKQMSQEERFALMFEELGTSFVKFGQLLATRDDIIGPDYAQALSKLQDDMRPFSTAEAKRIIKEELGTPANEIFAKFEDDPIASASIAQVHRATLKGGEKVVVKIQRPGIEETIKEDLRIMHYLAYLADKNFPELRQYDPQYLVDEFERSILKELNFLREARNAERFKQNFKDDKGIYVPKIYDNLSTRRVLTMEEIKGTRLTEIIASRTSKFDKKLIARKCLDAYLHMILIDGFYHADPHPGNIIILDRNVVCFIDFGRCATIDKEMAEDIFGLVLFAVDNDVNGLISHLIRTNMIKEGVDTKRLKADLTDLLEQYYSPDVSSIKMGAMLGDLMNVISKYDFNRPTELAELTRTLLILEGAGMQLDPKFNIAEAFESYSRNYMSKTVTPGKIMDLFKASLLDFQYIARDLPSNLRSFMSKIAQGKIILQIEHKNLEIITNDLKDMSDKISVALILAALIVGTSIIVQATSDGLLGYVLFLISAALGIWMVLKILVL